MEGTRLVSVVLVRFLVITVFYCNLYLTAASHWSKGKTPDGHDVLLEQMHLNTTIGCETPEVIHSYDVH